MTMCYSITYKRMHLICIYKCTQTPLGKNNKQISYAFGLYFLNYNVHITTRYMLDILGWVNEYYNVLIWIMEVFVTGILHTLGNDNINCRKCCNSVEIGIGNGNNISYGLD